MFRRDIKDWLRKLTNAFRFPVTAPTHCTRTKLWIESHPKQGKYHVIDEAQVGERVPPKTIEGSLHWKFAKSDFSIPETYCASIPDGRCFSHYGVVITPDHQVLRDVSIDFKSASHTHFAVKRGNLPGIQRLEGKIGVLVSKGAHHYFHWLFDALCRVDLLRRSGLQVDRYIVHQSYPFHNQYLELLGIEEERIVPVEKQTHIQAEELVVPSLPNATWVVSQRSCSFLRSSIFESLGLRKNQNEGAKRRIYISRAKAEKRSVVDEEGLFAYLQDYGFERVILEGLPVGEQVNLFRSASIVFSPHGAGLSNLVFCHPKTKVIELFSPKYVNVCYWSLCSQLDLDYCYLIGEGKRPPNYVDPHAVSAPIKINLSQVKDALELMDIRPQRVTSKN